MSLINDALKRANEAQKKRPTSGPLGVPLRPAVGPQKPSLVPAVLLPVVLIAVLGGGFWLVSAWWKSRAHETEVAVATPAPAMAPKPAVAIPIPLTPAPQPIHPAEVKHAAPPVAPAPVPVKQVAVAAPVQPVVKPKPTPVVAAPPAPVPTPVQATPKPVVVAAPPPTPTPVPAVQPEVKAPVTPALAPAPVVAATPPPEPKPEFPTLKLQGIFYRRSNPSALISGKTVFVGEKVQGAKVIEIDRQSVTLEFHGEKKTYSFE